MINNNIHSIGGGSKIATGLVTHDRTPALFRHCQNSGFFR